MFFKWKVVAQFWNHHTKKKKKYSKSNYNKSHKYWRKKKKWLNKYMYENK